MAAVATAERQTSPNPHLQDSPPVTEAPEMEERVEPAAEAAQEMAPNARPEMTMNGNQANLGALTPNPVDGPKMTGFPASPSVAGPDMQEEGSAELPKEESQQKEVQAAGEGDASGAGEDAGAAAGSTGAAGSNEGGENPEKEGAPAPSEADQEEAAITEEAPAAKKAISGEGSAPPAGEEGPGGAGSPSDTGGGSDNTAAASPTPDAEQREAPGPEGEAGGAENAGPVTATDQVEPSTPRSPEEDPAFQAMVSRTEQRAANQQRHQPAETAARSAQLAAPSPSNEREGRAQALQVEEMDQQEPGTFDAQAFKAMLMEQIRAVLPKNEEEADEFSDGEQLDQVKASAVQSAASEQRQASGSIERSTEEPPDISAVEPRAVEALTPEAAGAAPAPVAAAEAMPGPRGDSEVSQPLQDNMAEVDQTMNEAGVTEDQLARSNEPAFNQALASRQEARAHTDQAPAQFRQEEQQTLSESRAGAGATSEEQLAAMHRDRTGIFAQVAEQQQQTAGKDSSERQQVADHIDQLYEKTKTDVEGILSGLEAEVVRRFDQGAERANRVFEDYVERKMEAYKEERYGGVSGFFRRVRDVFTGLPDEVNVFFTEGRQLYLSEMDVVLTAISEYVAEQLNAAKERITAGRQQIGEYVMSLPEHLQQAGKESADAMQSQFDELEESVNSKQEGLVNMLADKYRESLEKVDTRIEEMKASNRGLVDVALGAITGVIQTILQIKNMLFNLLSAAMDAIGAIISDPIGFLGKLISGIKQGFENFFGNIFKNVMGGLIEWLTGSLGSVGIQIPDNLFSLSGIFSLVTQMLGLTWDYFRSKAVRLLGEPVVNAMEKGFELFQIVREKGIEGLWEYIKEQFTDLKETVMDAIRDLVITKVIDAGIKWVLGLLSPAGAFIKAAMMIIDIVKFFVQRAAQIMDLVNAFIDGIRALASGNVSAVARAIEKALVRAIPVLIGFLASLVGITGLTARIQKIIGKVRKKIDKVITKIIKKAKRLFGGKKKGKKVTNKDLKDDDKKSESSKEHDEKVQAGLKFLKQEEKKHDEDKDKKLTEEEVKEVAKKTRNEHNIFKSITPKEKGGKWVYYWKASSGQTPGGGVEDEDLTVKFSEELNASDPDSRPTLIDAIRRNVHKLVGVKNWADLVTQFSLLNQTKQMFASPMGRHQFGDKVKNTQASNAFDNALKNLSNEEKKNELKSKKKDWIENRSAIVAGERTPKAKVAKTKLQDQIVKATMKNKASEKIREYYEESMSGNVTEEHINYDPIKIDLIANKNKIIFKYYYEVEVEGRKERRDFESSLSLEEAAAGPIVTQKTSGFNLVLKKPRTRGKTASVEQTGARGSIDAETTSEIASATFDASHVLADMFLGSGYRRALNLVTASATYNRETMKTAEDEIKREIGGLDAEANRNGNYVTFDMTVEAKWKPITDSKVIEELRKLNTGMQPEDIEASRKIIAEDVDPKLVQEVIYAVDKVKTKDANNNTISEDENVLSVPIGPDVTLQRILN